MRLVSDIHVYSNPFLEPVSLDVLAVVDDDDTVVHPVADTSPDSEEICEAAEIRVAVGRFVDSLEARDRELLTRIFWDDESQASVARAFRVSGAAISKRLNRVLARGRVALRDLKEPALLQ